MGLEPSKAATRHLPLPPPGQCPTDAFTTGFPFTVSGDLADAIDAQQTSCAFGGGNDYRLEFTAPADGDYLFATGNSGPTDVVVALMDECRGTELSCGDTFTQAGVVRSMLAGQTVLVVVEGYSVLGNGPFQLDIVPPEAVEISCADGIDNDVDGAADCADDGCRGIDGCGPEVCDDGIDNDADERQDCRDVDCIASPDCCPLETTNGVGTYTSSTVGLLDANRPSCRSVPAPEVTFEFVAPGTGTYTFDTVGSNFDTVLYALDGCAGAELACNDDTAGLASELRLDLQAEQRIIVVVDGSNEFGSVVLNIR